MQIIKLIAGSQLLTKIVLVFLGIMLVIGMCSACFEKGGHKRTLDSVPNSPKSSAGRLVS